MDQACRDMRECSNKKRYMSDEHIAERRNKEGEKRDKGAGCFIVYKFIHGDYCCQKAGAQRPGCKHYTAVSLIIFITGY